MHGAIAENKTSCFRGDFFCPLNYGDHLIVASLADFYTETRIIFNDMRVNDDSKLVSDFMAHRNGAV